VTLQGTRVRLRDFVPDDLDATMAIVGDPAVTRWLSFDTRTPADQARRLALDVARAQADPRPDYYLAVELAGTGELVGFARLGLGGGHRCGEVGYAIRRDHQRKGYAAEATDLLLELAFTRLGLHRVTAATGPDNTASRAVLERLGFTLEGRMREHVFTNGAWRDSLLFSILEHEWSARAERDASTASPGTGAGGATER
jgi:ribosomal-protein-alanine N-acetyltransferase